MKIDIQKKFTDKKILELTHKNYPVYKDLEIYKVYEFEIILEIHENLIEVLLSISHYLKNKDLEIHKYEESNNIGFNINNFINTIKYECAMIKEQALLYLNYLEYFNNIYLKYFNRFITKIKIFYSQINNDIKLEDKNLKKNMLNNLESDNIDMDIINDIKNTLSEDKDNKIIISTNKLENHNNLITYSNFKNENNINKTIIDNSKKENNLLSDNIKKENIISNSMSNNNLLSDNFNIENIINENIPSNTLFNSDNNFNTENIINENNLLLDNFNTENIINENIINENNLLLDNFNNENFISNFNTENIINENTLDEDYNIIIL
jgi:hypothetical protein